MIAILTDTATQATIFAVAALLIGVPLLRGWRAA